MTRVVYDETLPEGCPVLIIRTEHETRVQISPEWGGDIAALGLPGAVEVLDRLFAVNNQQDGCPVRLRSVA